MMAGWDHDLHVAEICDRHACTEAGAREPARRAVTPPPEMHWSPMAMRTRARDDRRLRLRRRRRPVPTTPAPPAQAVIVRRPAGRAAVATGPSVR
jgi:hypothetical protein